MSTERKMGSLKVEIANRRVPRILDKTIWIREGVYGFSSVVAVH